MGWITQSYRRQITAKGRALVLASYNPVLRINIMGYSAPVSLSAENMVGYDLGDVQITLLAEDLEKQGWKKAFEPSDTIEIDAHVYNIKLASAIHDGSAVCAWRILAVGGLRGESYG